MEASFELLGNGPNHGKTYLIPGSSVFGAATGAVFVRGDSNLDKTINLTDAVFILSVLFLGKPPSFSCADAADTNDDGILNLTDAVFLLGYQFLGGPAPPAPFPSPGTDPTPDPLDCQKPRGGQ